MYNRYIPQGDGSFQRKSIPDPPAPNQVPPPPFFHEEPAPICHPHPDAKPSPPCPRSGRPRRPQPAGNPPPHSVSAGSFLKQLLPKDLDTEDLLTVILLLLMAGDCQQEQNSALLTLALYLFL